MNQYSHSDLTDGGNVFAQNTFPSGLPQEYIQHSYEELQKQFAIALYDAIQRCKHPVVIEIFEDHIKANDPVPYGNWLTHDPRTTTIKFAARLTPVERRHCVMNVLDDYDDSAVRWSNEKHSITYHNFHKSLDKFLSFFGIK